MQRPLRLAAALPLVVSCCLAWCQTPATTSATLEAWGYGSHQSAAASSPLNPANSVLHVPRTLSILDVRLNLRAVLDDSEWIVQPRWLGQSQSGSANSGSQSQGSLRQAFARLKGPNDSTWTLGRQVMAWGPANFRSPSSPFYFDSGKLNPLREVSGIDLVRYQQVVEPYSLAVGYVTGTSAQPGLDAADSVFVKIDHQAADYLLSANLTHTHGRDKPFFGAFGQFSANDAWMLYGEYGHGPRARGLVVTPSARPPLLFRQPGDAAGAVLLGASYTLLNGQVASLEYLHDRHGLSNADQDEYFRTLRRSAQLLLTSPDPAIRGRNAGFLGGVASQSAGLLGRDYLSLLWQSNPQEPSRYWRIAATMNLHDRSRQLSGYLETSLSPRISLIANVVRNMGPADSEFMSVVRSVYTLGLKAILF